jgi:hypothetical protein
MTAALDTFAPTSALDSLERLVTCSNRYLGTAGWWTRLAATLDVVREQLAHADMTGLSMQVIADAPELAAAALRLPDLEDQAQAEAAQLRMEVAEKSGIRSEAIVVREAAKGLIARVRHIDKLSDTVLHDAYLRDFGGE